MKMWWALAGLWGCTAPAAGRAEHPSRDRAPFDGSSDTGLGAGADSGDSGADSGKADTGDSGTSDTGSADSGAEDSGEEDSGYGYEDGWGTGTRDCSPGPGTGSATECFERTTWYRSTVQDAIYTVIDAHPEWFTWQSTSWLVADGSTYRRAVVEEIANHDLCPIEDPNAGDEIAVKHDNRFAEQFDILTSDNEVRYGDGMYNGTCAPAWF